MQQGVPQRLTICKECIRAAQMKAQRELRAKRRVEKPQAEQAKPKAQPAKPRAQSLPPRPPRGKLRETYGAMVREAQELVVQGLGRDGYSSRPRPCTTSSCASRTMAP